MAGQSPNSTNIDRVASATSTALHLVCHPEYLYWRSEWQKLRDCISGEREIKRKGERYLKPMKGSDAEDYKEYLDRSTYYNMTAQTLNGMLGQVFRRDPQIRNLPTKFKNAVRKFGKDGSSHVAFTKGTVGEQLGVGRIGILVDAPATTTVDPTSFAVAYTAENILDWDMTTDDWGMYVPSRVLLREFERQSAAQLMATVAAPAKRGARTQRVKPQSPALATSPAYQYQTVYRELTLEPHPDYPDYDVVYVQRVYLDDPTSQPKQVIVPNVRGTPLTFIPFQFKGSNSITADIEKPPLLDIADLNLSHFRTYAELELGRTYTALPTYYAQVRDGQGASEYHIGPNRVWEVGEDQVPGILEYKGEGLKALETALATKEQQIAAKGATPAQINNLSNLFKVLATAKAPTGTQRLAGLFATLGTIRAPSASTVTRLEAMFRVLGSAKSIPGADRIAHDLDTIGAAAGRAARNLGALPGPLRGLGPVMRGVGSNARVMSTGIGSISKPLGGAAQELREFNRQIRDSNSLFRMFSTGIAGISLTQLFSGLYDTNVALMKLDKSLLFATGTFQGSATAMQQYINMSQQLGVSIAGNADAFGRFAISSKTSGYGMNDTMKVFGRIEGLASPVANVGTRCDRPCINLGDAGFGRLHRRRFKKPFRQAVDLLDVENRIALGKQAGLAVVAFVRVIGLGLEGSPIDDWRGALTLADAPA